MICTSSPYQSSSYSNVLSATLNGKIGRNTFTAITALTDYQSHVVDGDIAQVIVPVVEYNDIQKGGTFSQELRLTSPNGEKLEWLGGAYFQHTDFARGNDGNSPMFVMEAAAPYIPLPAAGNPAAPTPCGALLCLGQPGDEGFINSKTRSTYEAVFAQGTYHFNDQFALTLGARGQTEQKYASIANSSRISPTEPLGIDLLTASLTPTGVNADFSHRSSMFTWNATGEYHPNKDTMAYLTVSRGGKSNGYNIGFGSIPDAERPYKDEFVTNYEAGVKTSLFDGRAKLSASVFHADYHNYQNASFIGLQFLVNNAARASVNGAEANGAFALGHGFTPTAAATWLDAKYDDYKDGSCYWWTAGLPYGAATPSPTVPGSCNLSGKTLPLTPHFRTSAGVQYKHSLPFGGLYSRVDWTWQSSELTDTNLDPRSEQAAFSLVNARAGGRKRQDPRTDLIEGGRACVAEQMLGILLGVARKARYGAGHGDIQRSCRQHQPVELMGELDRAPE